MRTGVAGHQGAAGEPGQAEGAGGGVGGGDPAQEDIGAMVKDLWLELAEIFAISSRLGFFFSAEESC